MRTTITALLFLIVLNIVGCSGTAPVAAAGWPCAVEASYECQVYRYHTAP